MSARVEIRLRLGRIEMTREIYTGEFEQHLEREIAESARMRSFLQFNSSDTVRLNVTVTEVQAF